MNVLDSATFFTYVRRAPFGNRLTQNQVDGLNALLEVWQRQYAAQDPRWLAYVLATAFHETGNQMQPVREGFKKTDAEARRYVEAQGYRYAQPDPSTGLVYYGRGHVQLTWSKNYEAMGKALGLPLYEQPDLALQPDVSAQILFKGMVAGMFTGRKLADYFSLTANDPVGARAIVNGTDKAPLIATYHQQFLSAIQEAIKARQAGEPPADVHPALAEPDGPRGAALAKDKAGAGVITLASAGGSAGVLSMLVGAVNSVWGVLALLIIVAALGTGLWLYFSGRLDLSKKGGV